MKKKPPTRIGIDARSLRSGHSGIATYVGNLLGRIPCLEPLDVAFPANNLLFNLFRAPAEQARRGWALYHAPAYTAPLVNFCPMVLTVHDISYFVRDDWYPHKIDALRRSFYRACLHRAHRILAPSDFSAKEISMRFPGLAERVRRTYLGVSSLFCRDEAAASRARARFNLPASYLLHVGDIHTRRNVDKIAAAAQMLRTPLVLVGKILKGGEAFQSWPFRFSGVSMDDLRGIYSAARVLVCASEYEGFGLPLLEAMACGLPVVAAKRSCTPEICGSAALLVEPTPESIAAGVSEALSDPDGLIEKGLRRAGLFSWDRTARETLEVYREVVDLNPAADSL